MSELTRSILLDLRSSENVSEQETSQETRLGTWSEPKYICSRIKECGDAATNCSHARPHKERTICRTRWRNIIGLTQAPPTEIVPIPYDPEPNQGTFTYSFIRIPTEQLNWWHQENTGFFYRNGIYCANCVAIPESRKFTPLKRAKLSKGNTKVICPAAIPSCIGRCSHAEEHLANRYCKDKFDDHTIHLQCRPVSKNKHGGSRGVLFEVPKLSCHI